MNRLVNDSFLSHFSIEKITAMMHATARMNGHRKRQQMVQLRCEAPLGCCAGRINDHGLDCLFYLPGGPTSCIFNFFLQIEKNPTVGCLCSTKMGILGLLRKVR